MRIISIILTLLLTLFWANPISAASIVINEIMANPPSGEKEWVEFYNNSSLDISLSSWSIQEKTSSGTFNDYAMPSVILSANSLCFYEFSTARLNNDGDTVNLLDSNGTQQDSYSYTSTITGKTFSRIPDGGTWNTQANPSKTTSSCSSLTASSSPSPTPTSSSTTSSSSSSSFTISNLPSEIDSTETFNTSVNLSLSSKSNTVFYLKGAFKQKGGTNYFGLTKVGGSWIKNSTKHEDQYKITTDSSGNWSGSLEMQPDIMDSGYEGSGEYSFKVGRYTEDGSLNWSNESNIKINTQSVEVDDDKINLSSEVLGESQKVSDLPEQVYSLENYRRSATFSATPSSSPAVKIKGQNQNLSFPIVGVVFLGIGLGFGGYKIYKNRVKS